MVTLSQQDFCPRKLVPRPPPFSSLPIGRPTSSSTSGWAQCEFFDPGEQVRYNEQATFRYSVDGQQASALVDLTGLTVTITAPAKKNCPHAT